MQLVYPFAALLASLPLLVSASPVPFPRGAVGLPAGTTMLGFDLDGSVVQAYNNKGTVLGNVSDSALPRRDGATGTCAALDATQMQTIPGWPKLVAETQKNWGTESWIIKTNPPEWLNNPAIVCVNDRNSANPPKIVATGTPNCADSSQSTDGQFIGVAGAVSLTGSEGTTASSTTTVTKQSSIGVDVSVSAEVDFPLVAKFTTTVISFTNSLAKSTTSGTNTMQGRAFTINPTAGQGHFSWRHISRTKLIGPATWKWTWPCRARPTATSRNARVESRPPPRLAKSWHLLPPQQR
ncbi:hypothetical protein DFH09DRAFT_1181032, partial [Mycena vulgaris]